ncbi:MAG: DNA repair protein RecN [Chthoniobacterales bacterium]|nr:DNA repair protein RecN [Chthoniobacterales bacterium]
MLATLKIRNLALVEELTWDLPAGFVAITGETGAGKSVILGALKFLIGERADRGLVRHGATMATLEAVFHLPQSKELDQLLEERGVDPCDEGTLILRRSISTEAAGRQFVNGSPCNVTLLRELGERLIDLHGPHDHQSLFSRSEQTLLLDSFSGALMERTHYLEARKKISALLREQEELLAGVGNAQQKEQWAQELEEISSADFRLEEEEELIARHRTAAQGKRLSELAALAAARLSEDEVNVASVLAEVTRSVRELVRLDPQMEKELGEVDLLSEQLQGLSRRLANYSDSVELDQQELLQLEERLDLFAKLKRKYGATLSEVMEHGKKLEERLASFADLEERLASIELRMKEARKDQQAAMKQLSTRRQQGAKKLITAITAALTDLGFRQAGFQIALETLAEPGTHGGEEADFLFAPNPGEPLQPLRMIASSGEVSRVMLALKSAMAHQDRVPLLVFDEIDANVGGEIALRVGAKMKELGKEHQVLCITHLPQVAAAAAAQFVVEKEVRDGRTSTSLHVVEGKKREEEIARMLGGASDSALAHAKVLLKG